MSLTYSHLSGSIVILGSITASGGFSGSVTVDETSIDHNNLNNYESTRHIDHSAVSINAGLGLTGGGTIQSDRSLALDGTSGYFTSSVQTVISSNNFATTGSNVFKGDQNFENGGRLRIGAMISGSGQASIAHGLVVSASGAYSAVIAGINSHAKQQFSTTIGEGNLAEGTASLAAGRFITASGDFQIALGAHNIANTSSVLIVGDGTGHGAKSNVLDIRTGEVQVSGSLNVSGDITAYYSSDERLKENITRIQSPSNKVKLIHGVEFDWIPKKGIHNNKGHDVGVIAQDVEKVLPDIVITKKNGYKAVNYEKLVALLIEVNKDLLERVEELERKKL